MRACLYGLGMVGNWLGRRARLSQTKGKKVGTKVARASEGLVLERMFQRRRPPGNAFNPTLMCNYKQNGVMALISWKPKYIVR
jgi:hypothetical protein